MDIRDEQRAKRAFRARLAVSAAFLCNGLILAAWVSRIPEITSGLDLSSGQTGTALMGIALGSITIFPFCGRLVSVYGSANVVLVSGLILAAAMPFVSFAPSLHVLLAVLYLSGLGVGGTEVSMNSQGVEVERFARTNIMSSLHGFFSVGAFAGAGIGAGLAALDVSPRVHLAGICLLCAVIYIVSWRWMIPDSPESKGTKPPPAFSFPPRALWALGLVGIAVAVTEGGVADWGGLYLHEELHRSAAFAALGFTVFQLTMLIGRFLGDRLVFRFGAVRVLRVGSLIAAVGLAIGIGLNEPMPVLVSFMLAGGGVAVAFPLVFSAAANRRDLPRGQSVAAISSLAYTGFLAGPPILGWFAEATSLRTMFGVIVLLCVLAAVMAGAAKGAGEIIVETSPVAE
ncbi:MAG: MFS transporter [Thermomicrobiales bacterium]|nr:MFS transporter [Thermomicrobiales bacterium]